ncbi:MAG TPA: hypothetical protein VGC91_06955 [Pyrinomonadaceae bacterium]|jgi:hypothetical protein
MAAIELRHNPGLDVRQLGEAFEKQFKGKYEVYTTFRRQTRRQIAFHGVQRVVVVKKNWLCGAFILVEQKPNQTRVKVWSDPPSEGFFKVAPLVFPLLLIIVPVMKILSRPIIQDVRDGLKQFQA